MNKTQRKIGWWMLILLSVISVFLGLWILNDTNVDDFGEITIFVIFMFIIPVIFIGGYGFIVAGQKTVKPAASNEPVEMERVDFENKKTNTSSNTSDAIPSDKSEEADIEGMVVCKSCGKMKKPQGMCPHCHSWRN